MIVCLRLNGIGFSPVPAETAAASMALAAGEVDETAFARWIGDKWPEDAPRTLAADSPRGKQTEEQP